ncbi:MAG: hypothetical protein Q9O62_14820 [Ardenticatenia bacterium]|nr:hypothetical protein [Ardenticatenia bacterium]
MRRGAVILDFSIDNGGCVETSRPTNHANPAYVEEGVIHFCVPNVPARVARTASYALSNAILPYVLHLSHAGLQESLHTIPELRRGVNVVDGRLAHPGVAAALGRPVEVTL